MVLARLRKILKKARLEGEGWPLAVAAEVVNLSEHWNDPNVRQAVGRRMTFNQFLRENEYHGGCGLGKNWTLGRFIRAKNIVDRLGEDCRRTWLFKPAQWAYNACTLQEIEMVKQLYHSWCRLDNNDAPLSIPQVRRHVLAMREEIHRVTHTG
jgi:hypothetical protein